MARTEAPPRGGGPAEVHQWPDSHHGENRVEFIKAHFAGREAWLFSDTPAGAHASALTYSLVGTARANGLEPSA